MASPATRRNDPASFSCARRAAVLFAALVVVALGGGAAVWSWSPAPPPPANAPAISDTAAAGEVRATTCDVPTPKLPTRSEAVTRTAVVGRALDSSGAPLAGFGVTLQRTDPNPVPVAPLAIQLQRTTLHGRYPPGFTASDAEGGFAFESLAAGNYRCYLPGHEQHAETFALAAGEIHELTLQSRLVVLTATVLRRGEVAEECLVEFNDGNEPRHLRPNKTGVMRRLAAPGRCEVIVFLTPGVHHNRGLGPCLSRHVLLVPDNAPALQCCFETGGTEIAFAVEDAQGQAIEQYTIDIEGTGAFDREPAHHVLPGTRGKPAAMAILPAGQWRATVTSDGFRVESRDFSTGLDDGRVVLSFVASPAATVRLMLRESAPFVTDPDAQHLPALVVDGRAVPCMRHLVRKAGMPLVFDYRAVPPGRATLCLQDRIEGDELVPLPFEPVAPVTIDVAAGRENEVTIDVVPRAFVDLRGCDASGMEMSTALLTVWVDGRRVRNRDAKTSQRWLGGLPPGIHRVVVDRNGASREHVLRVDRVLVSERYRP